MEVGRTDVTIRRVWYDGLQPPDKPTLEETSASPKKIPHTKVCCGVKVCYVGEPTRILTPSWALCDAILHAIGLGLCACQGPCTRKAAQN